MKHSGGTIQQGSGHPITVRNTLVASAIQSYDMGKKPSPLMWECICCRKQKGKEDWYGQCFLLFLNTVVSVLCTPSEKWTLQQRTHHGTLQKAYTTHLKLSFNI